MTSSSSRTEVSGPAGAVQSTQVAFLGHDAGREQVARTGRVSDLMSGALDLPTPKESCPRTQQETVTDGAPCPHSGSSTRMRQLLSAFRNCSSEVLRCPEDPPSVARHTPSNTLMSQSNILHRSRGSNRVAAHWGCMDDPFPVRHSGDRIS